MSILRKLLKVLLVLVVVVALAVLIVVWPVLGVNPFEGDQDHLWSLVSNEVDFFVRFPGVTEVLREPLAEALADQPGYEALAELRSDLAELTRQVAEQVNPQIPMDLVEVDFDRDFLGREMALAGMMRTDFTQLRFDHFIGLVRIPFYARFASALKRGFVRDRIPDGDRIAVEKGYYLKVKLDEEAARTLGQIRTISAESGPTDIIYVGRIRDVLLVSDEADWIEAALRGRSDTLPADPWFETEFIGKAREGRNIEFFMRPWLSANLLARHGNEETGGPLAPLRKFIPATMAGEVTVLATPYDDGVSLAISNNPPPDGYRKVNKPHLQHLYEREKEDLLYDLSENGIGRFIPRERTVGAMVLHMDADELVGLIMDFIPFDERQLLDDEVRRAGYRRGVEALLRNELFADLAKTHMVIIHRPSAYEKEAYTTFKPTDWDTPARQEFAVSFVCRVKDTVSMERVRDEISRNLKYFRVATTGKDKTRDLQFAKPKEESQDFQLLLPAYGVLPNSKHIVFSSHFEAAQAIYDCATDESLRLINDEGVKTTVSRLPRQGTLALLLRGEMLRKALFDKVREHADLMLDLVGFEQRKALEYKRKGYKDDDPRLDDLIKGDSDTYVAQRYPEIRDQYERAIAWVGSIDTIALACTLGIGPNKQVRARAYVRFDTGAEEDLSGE